MQTRIFKRFSPNANGSQSYTAKLTSITDREAAQEMSKKIVET